MKFRRTTSRFALRDIQGSGLALVASLAATSASAAAIDVGNPDFAIRWDNTVKYNYAYRVEGQDKRILNSPNYDDGSRNFDKGTVSNRVDILSELDFVYRRSSGFRVSAAAWYDDAYRRLDNDSVASSNHLNDGGTQALGLSGTTKRFHKGPSGEILDAFVFSRFDMGGMPLSLRAGRHTVFWGEALLTPFHGVGYGQAPLDLRKSASVPGTEAKELFLPRNAISAQLQANPELSLAAQYFLDWKPFRIPESGSFLGNFDMLLDGGESLILGPGASLLHGRDVTPDKRGDYGLSARWSPAWLDGTLGVYYRKTADIQPQLHIAPLDGQYYLVYPGDVEVLGVSLAKNIAGISIGAELSHRWDMPLESEPVVILPAPFAAVTPGAISALPSSGKTGGALGNTWHGVVNLLGTVGKTPVFDAASWITELQWSRWDKVTQGEAVFKGRKGYEGVDKVSKDFVGLGISFTPTWYQVFPGVDLTMPLFYSVGVSGNSAVSTGGSKDGGSYSVGVGADVYQKYQFDLRYVDFTGPLRTDANGVITSYGGPQALTRDRGFVSLTFKTSF
ncbi:MULTISPECIES: DUF1302 domain-containing protein [Pseudomonas aeruginosa group]|uniref:DUF1302 domain-containing protein n=1 Tax=Pseudomonas aeruginosa group TaxID=136841 RepID=UPI0004B71AB8|nr:MULTISPECIES: DUF1302 domain-containing protein [Pseudomonas aeruginosa group]KYO75107.1 hypothetical protein LT18_06102 [Pseudomonas aeruginosa]